MVSRKQSEGDVYHVIARGVGRQIIFEDDDDRAFYVAMLGRYADDEDAEILAWCLMSNHVHLLLHAPIEAVSQLMMNLQSVYARYFNERHEREGTLFQGRFTSVPICDDKQLVTALRYIHLNPVKAGGSLMYRWSSYREYMGSRTLVKPDFILDIVGGIKAFEALHAAGDDPQMSLPRRRLSEREALSIASDVLGPTSLYDVKALGKRERNTQLARLHEAGLSTRQIARLTGISQSIIARAIRK